MSQFKDMARLINLRNKNRNLIVNAMKKNYKIRNNLKFIEKNKNVKPSWFGIPILINRKINKRSFLNRLEKKGIQTRPIISGNFIKQPSIKKYKLLNKQVFAKSDIIGNNGFFIGLPTKKINKKFIDKLVKFFEKSL